MDNALYVGLSRQMTLRRQLDIVANNIANADTTGFKAEQPLVRTEPRAPARTVDGPNPIKFVIDGGLASPGMATSGSTTPAGSSPRPACPSSTPAARK